MAFVQVRLAKSVGNTDLPPDYPAICVETEHSNLLPGFDAVMLPTDLKAMQTAMKSEFEALESARIGREKERGLVVMKANIIDKLDPVIVNVMLAQENKIRSLEGGKAPLSLEDYKAELAATDLAVEAITAEMKK